MSEQLELLDRGTTGLMDACILAFDRTAMDAQIKVAIKVLRMRGADKVAIRAFKDAVETLRHKPDALCAAEHRAGRRPAFVPGERLWLCQPRQYVQSIAAQIVGPGVHLGRYEGTNDLAMFQDIAANCLHRSHVVLISGTTDHRYRHVYPHGESERLAVIAETGLMATKLVF